jgi:hypothetical protein
VSTPGRNGRRLAAAGGVAGLALSLGLLVAPPAVADDCSSPADCEQTAGYTAIIAVVGGAAAVAAAAAAAVAATTNGTTDGEEPEQVDLVIVQVEPGELEVTADSPATLRVTAWHVGPEGTPTSAPGVPLQVAVPPASGLTATPNQGTGDLVIQVTLTGEPTSDTVVLTASGFYKGRTATAQVTVRIGGDYDLELY